jgi:6,7-dimethyl-8-ribityllumazine synthase
MDQTVGHLDRTLRFAFIQAGWHADIVGQCREGFMEELKGKAQDRASVDVFDVPGAFEIPLLAKRLGRLRTYDAIIGSAFVVDGGIYRHEFVASTVVSGLMDVQLDTDTPVLSAVLTPHNYQETEEHRAFFLHHFRVKGREVARASLAVAAMAGQVAAIA